MIDNSYFSSKIWLLFSVIVLLLCLFLSTCFYFNFLIVCFLRWKPKSLIWDLFLNAWALVYLHPTNLDLYFFPLWFPVCPLVYVKVCGFNFHLLCCLSTYLPVTDFQCISIMVGELILYNYSYFNIVLVGW